MNEIVTVRDPDIIAAEINTIKKQVLMVMIQGAIEIGGKLTEAKSLVNHGEWGKWLEQNVDYSQSKANYLMDLYEEYGTGQHSMFDEWLNSETFAKLEVSKHVLLLALPFEERMAFAEENNILDMSTRQLQQAIRERDEAQKALSAAENEIEHLKDLAVEKTDRFEGAIQEERQKFEALTGKVERIEKDKARAEKSEQTALNLVKKLEKQLAAAQAAEKAAAEDLKKAQENPEVPEAVMEQMRKEVAADAAKQAAADLQKQLDAARKEAEEANRAREAAEAAAREAEDKILAAKKETRLSNPKVVVFRTIFEQMKQLAEQLADAYKAVAADDPDAAKNCRKAYNALLDSMDTALD